MSKHRTPRLRPRLLAALLGTFALCAAPLGAAPARPVGPELSIAEPGRSPGVAVRIDGSFVVAWVAPDGDGVTGVWVQRMAADGHPAGAMRRVGTAIGPGTPVGFGGPVVGVAADGGFVVAWTAPGNVVGSTVQVRRFHADGSPRAPAFRASGGTAAGGPRLAVAADGGFVVGWTAEIGGPARTDAFARRYDVAGEPLGAAFRVHGATAREQSIGGLALAPDGRFAAVFDSFEGEGDFTDVFLSLFAADGTPLVVDLEVNADPNFESTHQFESSVVALADGRWLVVFNGFAQDTDETAAGATVGRLLDAEGLPIGGDMVLNQLAEGDQHAPVAAPLADGGFVVLWQDDCDSFAFGPEAPDCGAPESFRDGHLSGVFGRAFDADGQPAGDDFMVNTVVFGGQRAPAVAANAAGDVVAAWHSEPAGFDPSASSVRARRLAAPCEAGGETLCLGDGRFSVEVTWRDFFGNRGAGVAEARDDLWGTFWFFDDENLELAVKLIDGSQANGHFWIFYGALSNVEYTLRVTDTASGRVATYHNPSGTFASRGDTTAFEVLEPPEPGGTSAAVAGGDARVDARATAPCQPTAERLCLLGGRFAVEIGWQDPSGGGGAGARLPLTDDTGAFWFFQQDNPEVVVKVLDARSVNGHFWVFFASLTNVAFELEVTDTASGEIRAYENPQGRFASLGDTAAFPLPAHPGEAGRVADRPK